MPGASTRLKQRGRRPWRTAVATASVWVERRPAYWRADRPGQTVSFQAAIGMVSALDGRARTWAVFYALAEDGSWAVQTAADTGFLPQWAVLNRCRAMLEPNRQNLARWPCLSAVPDLSRTRHDHPAERSRTGLP